jgi:TPR repeat protein
MYELGAGVAKDVRRAIDLYQIACKANDAAACAAATRLSKQ